MAVPVELIEHADRLEYRAGRELARGCAWALVAHAMILWDLDPSAALGLMEKHWARGERWVEIADRWRTTEGG